MAVRRIGLLLLGLTLSGLTLGGCMQQATLEPASEAGFTVRDKRLLANVPYERVTPPINYQRAIVEYHRKEAPGTVVVDTDARYLYQGSKDTLFRIHGTNQPEYIGTAISSGCIRMTNEDAIDLYRRVKVGTPVVVLNSHLHMASG